MYNAVLYAYINVRTHMRWKQLKKTVFMVWPRAFL